jgi:hypothetical protein
VGRIECWQSMKVVANVMLVDMLIVLMVGSDTL